MKKILVHSLVFLLVITGFTLTPILAQDVDVVSAATPWVPETPTTPAPPTTPATTPATPTAPANTTSATGTYVVTSGDSMSKIAAKYSMTLAKLLSLNPQITNRNLIYTGQKIIVNANGSAAAGTTKTASIYEGMGYTTAFRNGPGSDSEGVPVYSFNIAMARATFDAQGRIIDVFIDGYEIATPNYDGASMPHFSGWPGTEGYNVTNHDTASVSGISVNTTASAVAEVNSWLTKRQRGDAYDMNPANEWWKQMNFYQNFFKGKTVAELETWFTKNTTSAGRPIKIATTNAADLEKLSKLTVTEKSALADVVSGATMSVRDAHGDFLGAVGQAYKNRHLVTIDTK